MRIERTIQAKPTVYAGVLMRSKTEALAAEWLDLEGLTWVYEPETFIHIEHYTPDFYLPEIDTLIEVKPLVLAFEIDRIRGVVEKIGKTFVVIDRTQTNEFIPIDMYGVLEGCDPFTPQEDCDKWIWGWHSLSPSDRRISFDDGEGRLDRKRFYIGAGCFWRHKNGWDCPCTS